jgi:hypothetical protein
MLALHLKYWNAGSLSSTSYSPQQRSSPLECYHQSRNAARMNPKLQQEKMKRAKTIDIGKRFQRCQVTAQKGS